MHQAAITTDKYIPSTQEFTDEFTCSSYQLKASSIKMAILSGETKANEEISALTNAGTGCRDCICRIERLGLFYPSQGVSSTEYLVIKPEKNIWKYALGI